MSRLVVAPIVEGHGEVEATRVLLQRIWYELLGYEYIEVLTPIRQPRERLVRNTAHTLDKAVQYALSKLASVSVQDASQLIFLLVDADQDLPCQLGPTLLTSARSYAAQTPLACVIANVEFESWFVGAAESLRPFLNVRDTDQLPIRPEESRSGKAWIEDRFRGVRYSETIDQARLTANMDLQECRRNCPSFDKLCRELEWFK